MGITTQVLYNALGRNGIPRNTLYNMNRLSVFDFKSTKQRDQRLSYFSFPSVDKGNDNVEDSNANNQGIDRVQSAKKRSVLLWAINITLCIGIVTLLGVIGFFEKKHPFIVQTPLSFDIELASRVYPDISRFYIQVNSVKDVAKIAQSLPTPAHLGVIYTLDKCEPTHMALLAQQAHDSKIQEISLVSTTPEWSHVHACVHLLVVALGQLASETHVGIVITGPLDST